MKNIINIKPYAFISKKDRHKAIIQSIDFSESNQILLTAGMDKMIKFLRFTKNEDLDRQQLLVER